LFSPWFCCPSYSTDAFGESLSGYSLSTGISEGDFVFFRRATDARVAHCIGRIDGSRIGVNHFGLPLVRQKISEAHIPSRANPVPASTTQFRCGSCRLVVIAFASYCIRLAAFLSFCCLQRITLYAIVNTARHRTGSDMQAMASR